MKKEIFREKSAAKSSKVIGPIISGSPSDNIHDVTKAIWGKLSEKQRVRYNDLREMFHDSFNYHPAMIKDKRFDEYRDTASHNFALLVVWEEAEKTGKPCKHSFVKAQGIGGGYVFNYCNKCGATEQIK